jgi:hypothetical protein
MNTKITNDKPRFNMADFIIIIALIAVVAALALRIYNIFGAKDSTEKITLEFEVSCVEADKNTIRKNDKLYSVADNSFFGTVTEVEVSDAFTYAYNDAGERVKAAVPGKKNITGRMTVECTKTATGYYFGGKLLSEGETHTLYTKTHEFSFTVKNIISAEELAASTSATAAKPAS